MAQRIEALNDAERAWIESNLRTACAFVHAYAAEVAERLPSPAGLDRAWATWLGAWAAQPEGTREDPNPSINAVGIAFGQHLIDALGLYWAVVSDEHGTEMAVYGNDGAVLVFPANLVAKRFSSRTTGFIASLLHQMHSDIARLRRPQ